MSNGITLEQVEQLAMRLTPGEQLELVARIGERLSALMRPETEVERLDREYAGQVEAFLKMSDEMAAETIGEVDSAEDIRQIREDKDMTVHDVTIAKIRQLPESLAQEVSDFVDFLLMRRDSTRWQLWTQFAEALEIAESDFSDYLLNLEDYENRLARGEIQW